MLFVCWLYVGSMLVSSWLYVVLVLVLVLVVVVVVVVVVSAMTFQLMAGLITTFHGRNLEANRQPPVRAPRHRRGGP